MLFNTDITPSALRRPTTANTHCTHIMYDCLTLFLDQQTGIHTYVSAVKIFTTRSGRRKIMTTFAYFAFVIEFPVRKCVPTASTNLLFLYFYLKTNNLYSNNYYNEHAYTDTFFVDMRHVRKVAAQRRQLFRFWLGFNYSWFKSRHSIFPMV